MFCFIFGNRLKNFRKSVMAATRSQYVILNDILYVENVKFYRWINLLSSWSKKFQFFAATQHLEPLGEECMYVCMSVCMSVSISFFCHLLKKSSSNPYLKICDHMQYFFADAPMKKKNFKNFVYEGVQHFLDTKYKIIFLL